MISKILCLTGSSVFVWFSAPRASGEVFDDAGDSAVHARSGSQHLRRVPTILGSQDVITGKRGRVIKEKKAQWKKKKNKLGLKGERRKKTKRNPLRLFCKNV